VGIFWQAALFFIIILNEMKDPWNGKHSSRWSAGMVISLGMPPTPGMTTPTRRDDNPTPLSFRTQ
jgi:hypothetical protein